MSAAGVVETLDEEEGVFRVEVVAEEAEVEVGTAVEDEEEEEVSSSADADKVSLALVEASVA